MGSDGLLARSRLEFCRLGPFVRRAFDGGKNVAVEAPAQAQNDCAYLRAVFCVDQLRPIQRG